MSLSLPETLPNGKTLLVDSDFYARLHFGDASVGWNGDVNLGVYHENGRVEVWRWCEDGEPRCIVRSRPGVDRLDSGLLRFLAAHDSQRRGGFDVKAEVDKHNASIERDKERYFEDKSDEAIDKLHRAFLAEYGAHAGGLQKRHFTLGAAPWLNKKKDA